MIVAILERTPDWSSVPSGTPGMVMRLLRRCLEKDMRRRLRDIARLDLEDALGAGEDTMMVRPMRPQVRDVLFQRVTASRG